MIENCTHPAFEHKVILFRLFRVVNDDWQAIERSNLDFSFRIIGVAWNLLYDLTCFDINFLIWPAIVVNMVNQIKRFIFQSSTCVSLKILLQLLHPYGFICLALYYHQFTANYLITFETFCRIEIFWSPSFSTIMLTKLINCCSLVEIDSIQFSRILSVRLTIFGLESRNILSKIGKIALMDD